MDTAVTNMAKKKYKKIKVENYSQNKINKRKKSFIPESITVCILPEFFSFQTILEMINDDDDDDNNDYDEWMTRSQKKK